ncbi:MAG: cell wall hydrolase [Lachnospiraceae bacterium]|nr:cell wall hydrolase [Lachnospiraceae bacterium]
MNKLLKNLKRGMSVVLMTVMCLATSITVFADDELSDVDLHAGAGEIIHAEVENDSTEALAQAGVAQEMSKKMPKEEVFLEETKAEIVMANVKDSVNVREEADEEAKAVGKMYKNCGGIVLDRKDGWTYLESGELKGWAKDEYLLFGEEAEALAQEVGKLKATVKTDALRVRKEAGEDAGVYGLLELNQTVIAKEELGDWVAIQYDDDTVGYVSAEYVDVEFSVDKGMTNEQIKKAEEEKAKKKLTANRGAVAVGVNDVTLLAALIQCEAGSESYEGKLAVGAVVMNRVRSGGYPNTISEVIYARGQFPPATNGKVAAVVARGPSAACVQAAQQAIGGATNVGGATHFKRVGSAQGIVIGNHVFW